MFKFPKTVLLASALVVAGSTAHAATEIIGGETHIKLDPGFGEVLVGLNGGLPGLVGDTTFEDGIFSFGISGGFLGTDTLIEHVGVGLTLTNESDVDATVGDFEIRVFDDGIGNGVFGTLIVGDGEKSDFIEFFTFGDGTDHPGVELKVSEALGDTLVGFYDALDEAGNPTGATFGYAEPKPEVVPLPAAGWLLVAAVGGLSLMRRKQAL